MQSKKNNYTSEQKAECKLLFVQKEWSARAISRHFKGKPSATMIQNWANKPDPDTGLTWHDERKQKADAYYMEMSPAALASMIMKKIWDALQNPNIEGTKLADMLSKYQKFFSEMTEVDKQVPVMYHMLQDYILYSKSNYPEIVTEQFIDSIRAYKNHIRARLNNDFS